LHQGHDLGRIQVTSRAELCRHGIADQDVGDEDDSRSRLSWHIVNLYLPQRGFSSDGDAHPERVGGGDAMYGLAQDSHAYPGPAGHIVGAGGYIRSRASETWGVTMVGLVRMSFDSPEETRPFEGGKGQFELVNIEEGGVGRATFQPGWNWSEHVKPIAQTDSCQAAHMGYFISGRMKVVSDDGEEMEYGPGDFAIIPPGHDASVVGDVPCVFIDWQGFADYAKR
jgi:quercetin dioxygenase-like cupin family protein